MNEYIKQWNEIITNGGSSNTYKMAWARGIIEICEDIEIKDETVDIPTIDIAKKMLEYYWNQSIYFNLTHGSVTSKEPVMVQIAKEMIEDYFKSQNNRMPIKFVKIEHKLEKEYYNKKIKECLTAVKQDVCYRFLKVERKEYKLYTLSEDFNLLTFKREDVETIKGIAPCYIKLLTIDGLKCSNHIITALGFL